MFVASLLVATLLTQVGPATEAPLAPAVAPAPPTMPMPADSKPLPAPFTPKVTPYGFIDYQYSTTDVPAPRPNVQTFEFRRARIGLRGDVTKEIGFTIIYDGADNSMKDAWAALKYLPGLEVRLGQFKTPFGYEQSEADTKLLWVNNSYIVASLARGRDSRDEGVLALGKWKLIDPVVVEVNVAGVNGAGPNVKDDLNEKNAWGRAGVAVTLADTTARLGGSYGYGHQLGFAGADNLFGVQGAVLDDTYFYFHAAGADLSVDSPWGFLVAEWIQSRRHVTRFTAPTTSTSTDLVAKGFYVGAYGRTPWNLGPIVRYEEAILPTATGAARGTALNANWNKRVTAGAYYDAQGMNARFILNYEFDESARAIRTGNRFIAYAQVMY